ncbi:MAG: PqqD family protein [Proteobacteria bacterium]|nr:PqqD family protein [Pseudomonadota bacterium]MDA1309139.1 PqqD family protein [Pseudomonadota bacterium]
MARIIERDPDTSGTEVDGEIFLIKAREEDIHHLDAIASGLWRFLEHPRDEDELEDVMRAAFPDIPQETIDADLTRTLETLIEAGYLRWQPFQGRHD